MTEDNIFLCTFLSFVPKILYVFQALSLRGNSLSYDIIIGASGSEPNLVMRMEPPSLYISIQVN